MRAKAILALLLGISLGPVVMTVLDSLPLDEAAPDAAGREEILVAAMPLAPGTLLRPRT
jgi:hypothetical protein